MTKYIPLGILVYMCVFFFRTGPGPSSMVRGVTNGFVKEDGSYICTEKETEVKEVKLNRPFKVHAFPILPFR